MSRWNRSKSPQDLKRYEAAFTDWHWGNAPRELVDTGDDPDYPDVLVECGRFIRAHFRVPGDRRDTRLQLNGEVANTSHLAFDPDHPYERLYVVIQDDGARKAIATRFFRSNPTASMNLNDLARLVGGKHGKKRDYPNIQVKPIGVMTAVVYFTHKKHDGPSYYIHALGEESGVLPVLAADNTGRLWIAGGNMTSPTPGITD